MTMGKIYIDEVIQIAERWVGYKEKATNAQLEDFDANAGTKNFTIFGALLYQYGFYNGNKNGFDWCAQWFDAMLLEASGWDAEHTKEVLCYTGPYGASCSLSVNYYKAANRWHTSDPRPGDQIFFGTPSNVRHTGMVVRVEDGHVYTIEGNSGNMVRDRSYPLDAQTIVGYGRPRYDGDKRPDPFFEDVPKDSWYYDAVKWAKDNGIVSGTDETHFSPKAPAKRCEVVVMLFKLYQLMKGGG